MTIYDSKIEQAFANPKYTWRTIQGVSKETGVSEKDVHSYIKKNADSYIKSSSKNDRGENLYASRTVYRTKASPFRRIMASVKNRGG